MLIKMNKIELKKHFETYMHYFGKKMKIYIFVMKI